MNIVNELQPEHLAYWSDFEARVCTFTAPEEREVGIEPATGIITSPKDPADLGVSCVRVAWKPDEVDMANLIHGGTIWLSTWGGLPPHMLEVQPPAVAHGNPACVGDLVTCDCVIPEDAP
jgi:hypothetical protein